MCVEQLAGLFILGGGSMGSFCYVCLMMRCGGCRILLNEANERLWGLLSHGVYISCAPLFRVFLLWNLLR